MVESPWEFILLSGIGYRVARPEPWTVVFTQDIGIGGRPTRFMMYRGRMSIWAFSPADGWGDVPCSHIQQAYQYCINRVGDDFAKEEVSRDGFVEHDFQIVDLESPRPHVKCSICGLERTSENRYSACRPEREASI